HADAGERPGAPIRFTAEIAQALHEGAVAAAEEHRVVAALDDGLGDVAALFEIAGNVEIAVGNDSTQALHDLGANAAGAFVEDHGDSVTLTCLKQHLASGRADFARRR